MTKDYDKVLSSLAMIIASQQDEIDSLRKAVRYVRGNWYDLNPDEIKEFESFPAVQRAIGRTTE